MPPSADDRSSIVGDTEAPPDLSPQELAVRETANALQQFDRMVELIRKATGPAAKRFRLRPSTLQELNRFAIDGMRSAPGAWRTGPIREITGSRHAPPEWTEVPRFVDEMCEYVSDNWAEESPIHLASYVMWRLNWIHPFPDGNGRTSRASSYLVLCVRLGYLIPGHTTIPQRIAARKRPYYGALEQADEADRQGRVDVSAMEALLAEFLEAQLGEIRSLAIGGTPERPPEPAGPAWGGGD